jgi:septum formation protein
VPRLILASASPRRSELLEALGVAFEVQASEVDETTAEPDARRVAEGLALRKARMVAGLQPDAVILGFDTVVTIDGELLGKPVDDADARRMLGLLRGRTHEVVTGVALVSGALAAADHVASAVTMRDYSDAEVGAWIARGEAADKAGSYASQDPTFAPVGNLEGCTCSVIGLPLWTARRMLRLANFEAQRPAIERCASCPLREP